jgi:hypothetical protein
MLIRIAARALMAGALLVVATAATGGCAAVVTGHHGEGDFHRDHQRVYIDSTPQGAAVTINGVDQGLTPTRVTLNRYARQDVRLTLAGYRTHEQRLSPGFNPWFLGNFALLGAFPIGMLVDVLTGDVTCLHPQSLRVQLISER